MQKKIYDYMDRFQMLCDGMKVLVGFSGGADSTALLQLLWEYGRERGIEVCAVHVNHGIRGEEAERDQDFCERFCEERKIRFRTVSIDVPVTAQKNGIGMEEAGRQVRYEVFERQLQEQGIDRAALAHHQNDQAETMLFHLMRGTGLRGLRGMEPVRLPYIRPLLCVTRAEIVEWLRKKDITWMEDSTNRELHYTRNRIRHQVLAPMEEIRPGSIVRMAGTAERLLETESFLEEELDKWWKKGVRREKEKYIIALNEFERMHPVMKKRMVLRCLKELLRGENSVGAVHAEQICALPGSGRGSRVTLPGDCVAVLGYEELVLKRGYGIKVREEEVYCFPGETYHYMGMYFSMDVENYEKIGEIPVNRYTKWFDYDKIKNSIVLRTRRPGDYLVLSGGIHKKLKDYFINCKVPREERDSRILLADGSHVIWVTGMRISEGYKVTEQTKRILKVQMRKNGGTGDGETPY